MKHSVKIIVFLIALFFFSIREAYADGIQLSSTTVGTIATFTSQIPSDPCGTHKLGETKTRTVVGFHISTTPFNRGDDHVMRIVNEKRADLTDAVVSNFSISGRTITDFKENPDDYSPLNWQDFIHYSRTFNLNTPIEFTPQDTASITVTKVKITNKGTINPEFALLESNGQFCLGSKYTEITIGGTSAKPSPTFPPKPIISPTKSFPPTKEIIITPTIVKVNATPALNSKTLHKANKSIFYYIKEFFLNLINKGN